MTDTNNYTWILGYLLFLLACAPKIAEKIITPAPLDKDLEEVSNDNGEEISACTKFSDTPQGEEALTAHVLYRDYLNAGDYEEAFPYWQKAYQIAPAADGKRNTHYTDGIKFFEYFHARETDVQKRQEYVDRIFQFYDEIEACYGDPGYIAGLKAYDLSYKYPDRASDEERFNLFKKSIDIDGLNARFFILNPFADLVVKEFETGGLEKFEAQKYTDLIFRRLDKGLKDGENRVQWQIIKEYVPKRLEVFEGVKGFFDCDYYKNKYFIEFENDTSNCEVISDVYSRLRWGGCSGEDDELKQLAEARENHCIKEIPPSDARQAYDALQEGNYEEAIEKFKDAADNASDNNNKAAYLLLISKVYYSHLKQFRLARKYALEAANYRANWGEPYLLIGRLYASSGPLCGPGRGWDSQVVVWPAIDKWRYAKRIDPTIAGEADNLINDYEKYMPSIDDIFQRTLSVGQKFRVGCWIQETTTIRPAK